MFRAKAISLMMSDKTSRKSLVGGGDSGGGTFANR